jgi:hypothetical protein
MLEISDLDKLKFTSITNVIHFKYDDEFYFIHEGGDYTKTTQLYKGRSKYKNEFIKATYGFIPNLIKYKNNKKVLSAIDKENFIEKLYRADLIDTTIEEIKSKSEYKNQRCKELKEIIQKANEELRNLNWG